MTKDNRDLDEEFDRVENITPEEPSLQDEAWINQEQIEEYRVFGTVEIWETGTTTIWTETVNTIEFIINGVTYTMLVV